MPLLFPQKTVSLEDQWRGIILFGRNVASYKFALAKALLEINPHEGQLIKLEELAEPFAKALASHVANSDKQCTSKSSSYLDACRKFNARLIDAEKLRSETVKKGFVNVIDAFHVVGKEFIPAKFFVDERETLGGIKITSNFSTLMESIQAPCFEVEVESRWRLVETAWELGVSRSLVSVSYDTTTEGLYTIDKSLRRKSITGSRGALNGYQQGKCFYCAGHINVEGGSSLPDVDHFFPHLLKQYNFGSLIDGIWNLVLACKGCNRGRDGKSASLPTLKLLERLHQRNEYLIGSHHPLRETIIQQTGASEPARRSFMNDWYTRALSVLIHQWEPN